MSNPAKPLEITDYFFFIGLCALLVLRIATIAVTPLNLGPDEAQYWRWGQSFDWGYYSKPPIVAWVIGFTTGLFGHQEWAIRLASPIFHTGTAIMLYLAGRKLWSPLAGMMAGLSWALMWGVWLSSILMTTDVPLLFFWSVALYNFLLLREGGSWKAALGLGIAIGLGFLSKYAMIYFLIGLALALVLDQKSRKALLTRKGLLSLGAAFLVILPHIVWSAQNGFKTVSHTADNANWGDELLNPENAWKFFGDQFGVFGLLQFLLLLIFFALVFSGRSRLVREDSAIRTLLYFILPPLVIITVQAFISRAHANWAASAYPAACVVLGVWGAERKGIIRMSVIASFIVSIALGLFASTIVMLPLKTQIELGAGSASKRLRAWPETVDAINALVEKHNATAIILDERENWHGLDYYGRDGKITVPLRGWRQSDHAKSASEEAPITEADGKHALVLSMRENLREKLLNDFERNEYQGQLDIDLDGGKHRRFEVYIVENFAPAERKAGATSE
jgi:4-amino-4-deoxy-L-arabinose transferase-like glycosyltransferase